jgi:hypothetical protein
MSLAKLVLATTAIAAARAKRNILGFRPSIPQFVLKRTKKDNLILVVKRPIILENGSLMIFARQSITNEDVLNITEGSHD